MKAQSGRRRGIVWLASYPRSGNTWTRNFLYNLLNLVEGRGDAAGDINRLNEYSPWDIAAARFEAVLGKKIGQATRGEIAAARGKVQKNLVDEADGPVFVKTHNALVLDHGVPTVNMSVTAGAVYIVRNPLDVAISFAHHFDFGLDDAIARMATGGIETDMSDQAVYEVYGSWSQNVMSWTHKPHPAIHVLRYEDIITSPAKTFAGLARHLLIDATEEQIAKAIELSSFERAQAQERAKGYRERPMQSKAFFRKGRAEQWRTVLSKEQVERVIAVHREQMLRFDYVSADLQLSLV